MKLNEYNLIGFIKLTTNRRIVRSTIRNIVECTLASHVLDTTKTKCGHYKDFKCGKMII
ncbi:hypothetical protein Hanom_Chr01g00039191 [Helianthus anomalus]